MRIIIIGAGEVGYNIAKKLSLEQKDVILIDNDYSKIAHANEMLDAQVILGNGSSPEILSKAKIREADMLIAVTDSDETNMLACLFAYSFNRETVKVARIRNQTYLSNQEILEKSGIKIDLVINPERVVAQSLLKLLHTPGATNVVDFAEGKVKLYGVKITRKSPIVGKKLTSLRDIFPEHKVLVTAISRKRKVIVPRGNDVIKPYDEIFLICNPNRISSVMKTLGKSYEAPKRVMIMGGGVICDHIAEELEKTNITTKIIDLSKRRCKNLSDRLKKAIILYGDGTDQNLLEQENITDADVFMALTHEDDKNLLAALQAKRLGAKRVFALINKTEYIPIVSSIDIDVVISSRMIAVSNILQFVRRGIVLAVTELRDEMAEAIDMIVMENSKLVGKPINAIDFPKGALIGAIERNKEIIIPTGDDSIMAGDRLFIIATQDAIAKIEKVMAIKGT